MKELSSPWLVDNFSELPSEKKHSCVEADCWTPGIEGNEDEESFSAFCESERRAVMLLSTSIPRAVVAIQPNHLRQTEACKYATFRGKYFSSSAKLYCSHTRENWLRSLSTRAVRMTSLCCSWRCTDVWIVWIGTALSPGTESRIFVQRGLEGGPRVFQVRDPEGAIQNLLTIFWLQAHKSTPEGAVRNLPQSNWDLHDEKIQQQNTDCLGAGPLCSLQEPSSWFCDVNFHPELKT